MQKWFKWVAINGTFAAVVVYAAMGNQFAENAATFMVWLMVVIAFISRFGSPTIKADIAKGLSVPRSLDIFYDIAISCVFAGMGRWDLAILNIAAMFMFQATVGEGLEQTKKTAISA